MDSVMFLVPMDRRMNRIVDQHARHEGRGNAPNLLYANYDENIMKHAYLEGDDDDIESQDEDVETEETESAAESHGEDENDSDFANAKAPVNKKQQAKPKGVKGKKVKSTQGSSAQSTSGSSTSARSTRQQTRKANAVVRDDEGQEIANYDDDPLYAVQMELEVQMKQRMAAKKAAAVTKAVDTAVALAGEVKDDAQTLETPKTPLAHGSIDDTHDHGPIDMDDELYAVTPGVSKKPYTRKTTGKIAGDAQVVDAPKDTEDTEPIRPIRMTRSSKNARTARLAAAAATTGDEDEEYDAFINAQADLLLLAAESPKASTSSKPSKASRSTKPAPQSSKVTKPTKASKSTKAAVKSPKVTKPTKTSKSTKPAAHSSKITKPAMPARVTRAAMRAASAAPVESADDTEPMDITESTPPTKATRASARTTRATKLIGATEEPESDDAEEFVVPDDAMDTSESEDEPETVDEKNMTAAERAALIREWDDDGVIFTGTQAQRKIFLQRSRRGGRPLKRAGTTGRAITQHAGVDPKKQVLKSVTLQDKKGKGKGKKGD